ncbi:MAG: aminotransferase class III-fold pyridoxal phosphate-dependent enzyme, partial [Actinobacteria bacterium]|nr:aminotransferase class III-fold pyridoxal phosphate-dependent enzyme [Actinomycetota bacterium]
METNEGLGLTEHQSAPFSLLYKNNPALRRVFDEVARRQARSLAIHQRALESLSNVPSQLPFASPILPVCVESAEGSKIVDVDGNHYIDCHMAYTASVLGHSPAPVIDRVRDALGRGIGAGHLTEAHVELGDLVRKMVPDTERVAFFHSGGEAVTASVRIARAATRRNLVAKFEGCYHGWGDIGVYNTTMILSGRLPKGTIDDIEPQPATGGVTPGPGSEFLILPFNSTVAFDRIRERASELACVLVDPVPPFMAEKPDEARRFVLDLRRVTAEAGVPLVVDEVVSGFRLARGGAQEAFGFTSDMTCYGKITSGLGIPLTMVGGKAEFLDMARTDGLFRDHAAGKAWVSTTGAANWLSVVSALAQLRYVDERYEELTGTLDRCHAKLRAAVESVAREASVPIRLYGHPRLQSSIALGHDHQTSSDYRSVMA